MLITGRGHMNNYISIQIALLALRCRCHSGRFDLLLIDGCKAAVGEVGLRRGAPGSGGVEKEGEGEGGASGEEEVKAAG